MSTGGYLSWDVPILRAFVDDRSFYLGSRFYVSPIPLGISRNPSPGANVVATHAKTHKVQIPYTGTGRPDQRRAYTFTMDWQADDEDDYFELLSRGVSSEILDFCCFWWVADRFAPVTSGSTYQLSRRRADGLISGVDEAKFPTIWTADGAEQVYTWPTSYDSQEWVAPGAYSEVIVKYLPLTRVVVSKMDEDVGEVNDLRLSIELTEVLQEP